MNMSLLTLEILVSLTGIAVLLADLWWTGSRKMLGVAAATILGVILVYALGSAAPGDGTAFGGMFVIDAASDYFKGLFLFAGFIVLLLSIDGADEVAGYAEQCALILFALVGMLLAASANDFMLMFVALELITVTFYVLVSFQRDRQASLEAGVKYLILGALASGFMVFGTALIFGAANTTNFFEIAARQTDLGQSPLFLVGLLLTLVGLGFKIAAFPFQMWAPDVYQGAPPITTAFLATGSKAAGSALLVRVAFEAVPALAQRWSGLLLAFGVVTILYGTLCAIPQRNVKRLMGYSSIANAGFLLLGIAAGGLDGGKAVLTYLGGYVFTVLAVFAAVGEVSRRTGADDIVAFAGLGRRAPWLAAALVVGLTSLAGIPPMTGFVGKFLLFRAVADHVGSQGAALAALLIAVGAVVASIYYYFAVIRSALWPRHTPDLTPLPVSGTTKLAILVLVIGVVFLGVAPEPLVHNAREATAGLSVPVAASTTAAAH
jgi:NADH-quinone oxidoreductase subunit N